MNVIEIYLADGATAAKAPDQSVDAAEGEPNLVWKVLLRTGTWKLRPGPGGQKIKKPLKVFRDAAPKGHISLSAIKKNFDDGAIEYVTAPVLHADGTMDNKGYIRKLAIQDVMGEDGSGVKESLLWAGFEITEPDALGMIERKTIPSTSAGIAFDYERTEDGKQFDQVLVHAMLTNKPWINKTGGFTNKLPDGVMASEGDHEVTDSFEFETAISDYNGNAPDQTKRDQPATGTLVWKPEEGMNRIRGELQSALDDWRAMLRANQGISPYIDDFPYYRVDDVSTDDAANSSGKALVCSGYGDDRDTWVCTWSRDTDSNVVIEPFQNWTLAKQEYVAASETPTVSPSAERPPTLAPSRPVEGDALRMAQQRRAELVGLSRPRQTPGGTTMPKLSELLQGVELSDEQRAAIQREEEEIERDRALLAERQTEDRKSDAEKVHEKLDALGLGTPGVKAYVSNVMLSDDGEPALALSEATESGQRTQPRHVTASEILKGFVDALPKDDKTGRVSLSTQAARLPDDAKPDEEEKPKTPESQADVAKSADDLAAELSEFGLSIPLSTANGGK